MMLSMKGDRMDEHSPYWKEPEAIVEEEMPSAFWAVVAGALLALGVALLSGCKNQAEETRAVGRGFEVERLFEHEGCTAYRFYDYRTVYYVTCRGGRVTTDSSYWQSTGKSGYMVDVYTTTDSK